MRKIENMTIKYIGYKNPEAIAEVELEILGLETAMSVAAQRIAVLKQSLKLEELRNAEIVQKALDSNETE